MHRELKFATVVSINVAASIESCSYQSIVRKEEVSEKLLIRPSELDEVEVRVKDKSLKRI